MTASRPPAVHALPTAVGGLHQPTPACRCHPLPAVDLREPDRAVFVHRRLDPRDHDPPDPEPEPDVPLVRWRS